MGEVEAEVLINNVAPRIAVLIVKTLRHKLTKVLADEIVDTLAERLAHADGDTWLRQLLR